MNASFIKALLLIMFAAGRIWAAAHLHIDSMKSSGDEDAFYDNGDTLYVSGDEFPGSMTSIFLKGYKNAVYQGPSISASAYDIDFSISGDADSVYGWVVTTSIGSGSGIDSITVVLSDDWPSTAETGNHQKVDDVSPDSIEDLSAVPWPIPTGSDSDSVRITFQWPYDNDGAGGNVTSAEIKYSSQVIDSETDWDNATALPCSEPAPKTPGTLENFRCNMYDITPGTYYYAIQTTDNMGNKSPIGYETSGAKTKPVELAAFTATRQGGAVELYWMTESEVDNLKWRLKRSATAEGTYRVIYEEIKDAGEMTTAHQTEYHYLDTETGSEGVYYYILEDIDTRGKATAHGPIPVGGGLLDGEHAADRITLDQNTPNPMKRGTATSFHYYIPQYVLDTGDGDAEMVIYSQEGQEVARRSDETPFAGINAARIWWDGRDSAGQLMPEGLYIYKLHIGHHEAAGQLMIIR